MVASLSGTFINHAVIQQIYIGFLKVENSGFISKFKKLTRLISRVNDDPYTVGSFSGFYFLFFIFYQKLQKSVMIELQAIVIYNGPYVQIVSQLCSYSDFSHTSLTMRPKTRSPLLQLTVIYI